nr:39S ribosomal protein L35, mitochondrial [Onthophagus taurus]
MLRSLVGVLRIYPKYLSKPLIPIKNGIVIPQMRKFTSITEVSTQQSLLNNSKIQEISQNITRSVTKYSFKKGKRKAVKAVLKRFYRLDWGGWIRTKAGRNKRLWKKSPQRRRRLRQHVLCNGQQSMLLDKMVGSFWRKPKFYVDDPYNPYHVREEFRTTYVKPRPYFPKET